MSEVKELKELIVAGQATAQADMAELPRCL
jgi:hypothetical protein